MEVTFLPKTSILGNGIKCHHFFYACKDISLSITNHPIIQPITPILFLDSILTNFKPEKALPTMVVALAKSRLTQGGNKPIENLCVSQFEPS